MLLHYDAIREISRADSGVQSENGKRRSCLRLPYPLTFLTLPDAFYYFLQNGMLS